MKVTLSSALLAAGPALVAAQDCTVPADFTPAQNAALPDPFLFADGATRVASQDDWACRQQELSALIQKYELGTFPPAPSSVSSTLSGNTLSITVEDNGGSVSFDVTITLPSGASGAVPAIIGFGGGSIPIPDGVALINLVNDDIGAQVDTSSRGKGKFYDLYGSDATASATTAWAWGVGRIIDALEINTDVGIDPTKIGVTGCSRNGKGALIAGALETRVALTLAQESGSGGAACWRLSDAESAAGGNVQTASEIVGENCWFSSAFNDFANNTPNLPFDHHSLASLIAPRGLLAFENTDYEWLSPQSSFGCMTAASKVFEAVGVKDNLGFSQVGGHAHCQFPADQQPELDAFIQRFLFDQEVDTAVFKSSQTWDETQWIGDWELPAL